MSKRLSHHLVTFYSRRHYISGHQGGCALVRLFAWTFGCPQFQNFSDLKNVIGFQNVNSKKCFRAF